MKLKMTARPNHQNIAVGDTITLKMEVDASQPGLGYVSADDYAVWFIGEETDYRQVESWVAAPPERDLVFDRPGQYGILAILRIPAGDVRLGGDTFRPAAMYVQNVMAESAFMWDPVNKERTHVQDPQSAVEGVSRYLGMLNRLGLPLLLDLSQPGQAAYRKHSELVKKYERYYEKLTERLESTRDWIRIPFLAKHRPDQSNEIAELKVFLAHPKNDVVVKHWKVVDWTHPGDVDLDGEYDGKGLTDADGAKAAIKTWQDRNKYPRGTLIYEVPANVLGPSATSGSFSTTGINTLSRIANFLEKAGIFLAIVTFILIVAPIPGSQVAAAALIIGIMSGVIGAAAAGINIAERHLRGVSDQQADGMDALTIAGCVLGATGSWVRGARVAMRLSGTIRELVLVGEVVNDGVQGILLAESSYREIQQTVDNKTMTPDEKLKTISKTVGLLAVRGALIYINVKGTAKDMARMNNPKPPPPKKPPPSPHGEKLDGSPEENLKKLKDPNKKIDLTEDPSVTGNTKEGPHTTTVEGDPRRLGAPRPTFDEKFPNDPLFWRIRNIKDRLIMLVHRFHLAREDRSADLWFSARFGEDGIIQIDLIKTVNWKMKSTGELITDGAVGSRLEAAGKAERVYSTKPDGSKALVAKELFPMMFDHFEAVAAQSGTPIKGVHEQGTMSNYQAYKKAVAAGTDPTVAVLEKTETGPLWKAELDGRGYKYKMAAGFPREDPGTESVFWKLEVTK